jgi:hypothetical protein
VLGIGEDLVTSPALLPRQVLPNRYAFTYVLIDAARRTQIDVLRGP